MKLSHNIETVFGTSARIAIVRRLAAVEQPLSGRQLAELAGLTHRGAIQAISPLVKDGIVKQRRAGRAYQYTLARDNIAVKRIILPALRAESELRDVLKEDLVSNFAVESVSLILFGSFARRQETASSDVDLLAITKTLAKKEAVEQRAEAYAPSFEEKFAAPLAVHCLSMEEMKGRKQLAFVKKVSHEGILLSGKSVEELMRSGKTKDKKR